MAHATSAEECARSAVLHAARLGKAAEAYVQFGRTASIKVYGSKVESVSTAEPRGIGVRVVDDYRLGYAYGADLSPSGIDRVVDDAVANAQAADRDPFVLLPETGVYSEIAGLWRGALGETSLGEKTQLALRAETAALSRPEVKMVEESMYGDSEATVAVASTTGVEAESRHSSCWVYVAAHAERGGELQSGLGFTVGREPADLTPESAGMEAGDKARALLGASRCATGRYTLVLDRDVAAAVWAAIVPALTAEAVQKGRSVFAGRLGQPIGSPELHLTDDGLVPDGLNTSSFDGEGVPQQKTTLISGGVLRSYLHSTYTAGKDDACDGSTGNAVRASYRTLPGVGPTNLVVPQGTENLESVFHMIGEGLYVEGVAGLHSGVNPISGEISVGVTGRLIQGGTLGRPVREVTMAADFDSFLRSVVGSASDARWVPLYGSVYTPSIVVDGIAVSGS